MTPDEQISYARGYVAGQKNPVRTDREPKVPNEWMTVQQVMAMLQVGRRTVWRWCRSGFPSPFKIMGNCCRWRRSEIAAYLDALTHEEVTEEMVKDRSK